MTVEALDGPESRENREWLALTGEPENQVHQVGTESTDCQVCIPGDGCGVLRVIAKKFDWTNVPTYFMSRFGWTQRRPRTRRAAGPSRTQGRRGIVWATWKRWCTRTAWTRRWQCKFHAGNYFPFSSGVASPSVKIQL